MVTQNPTIKVTDASKDFLDTIKEHPRETYNDVLVRMMAAYKEVKNAKENKKNL